MNLLSSLMYVFNAGTSFSQLFVKDVIDLVCKILR